jgi:hypothetical protein
MRRVTGLAVVAILVTVLAVPSAEAKGSRLFGLNWSAQRDHEWSGKDARKLKSSGAKTVRWSLFWRRIEQSPGQFNWSIPDRVVGDLASKGIRLLPVVRGTPAWLADSPSKPPLISQRDRDAWKRYLREAVNRYGPGGTYWATQYLLDHPGEEPRPINVWQVWNEPNLESHWKPHPSAREYGRLLKLSDKAIEDADPRAKVMFAGMPGFSIQTNAWDFLHKAYKKRGVRKAFDIAALHPYSHHVRQMKSSIRRFRKTMSKNGDRRTPLWITEFGWGSLPKNATPYHLTKGKKGQARILRKAARAIKHKRRDWRIERAIWFNFRDPRGGTGQGCSFCTSAGLLNHDFSPKPSWRAFRSFTH